MPKLLTLCPMATWTVRKSNPVNTANINQMPPLFWQGRHFIFRASPHNSRLTAQAPLRRLRHGICVAKMLDNVGLRYPHRASGAKAPRTLRPLPLLRFAVSATGGAHLCSIQYYLRFWLGSCRTSLAVSALRIMRCCQRIKNNEKMVECAPCGGPPQGFFIIYSLFFEFTCINIQDVAILCNLWYSKTAFINGGKYHGKRIDRSFEGM